MFNRLKNAPWRKAFKWLGYFVLFFTVGTGFPDAVMGYAKGGWEAVASGLLTSAVLSVFLAAHGLLFFTLIWGMNDVPATVAKTKQFFRDLPENWRRFRHGVAVVCSFLWHLPGMCIRGILWLASLPSRWRGLSKRDKRAACMMVICIATISGIGYLLWPVASTVVGWLPDWFTSNERFIFRLFVDLFMSFFATIITLTIAGLLLDLTRTALRRDR